MKKRRIPKEYLIYEKIGVYPTAKILYENYGLKLYWDREAELFVVYGGDKYPEMDRIEASDISELMYLIDKLIVPDKKKQKH